MIFCQILIQVSIAFRWRTTSTFKLALLVYCRIFSIKLRLSVAFSKLTTDTLSRIEHIIRVAHYYFICRVKVGTTEQIWESLHRNIQTNHPLMRKSRIQPVTTSRYCRSHAPTILVSALLQNWACRCPIWHRTSTLRKRRWF